jgi:hypothetical protein
MPLPSFASLRIGDHPRPCATAMNLDSSSDEEDGDVVRLTKAQFEKAVAEAEAKAQAVAESAPEPVHGTT